MQKWHHGIIKMITSIETFLKSNGSHEIYISLKNDWIIQFIISSELIPYWVYVYKVKRYNEKLNEIVTTNRIGRGGGYC